MRITLAAMSMMLVLAAGCAPAPAADEARLAWLQQQNPFEIVAELHAFTYAQLHELYPGLDARMMQVLMIRIVASMTGS